MAKEETGIEATIDEVFDLASSQEFSAKSAGEHDTAQVDIIWDNQMPRGYTPDVVGGRYTIQVDQRLEHLDSSFARAYKVVDKRNPDAPRYALVYDNTVPIRARLIHTLKGQMIPGFITPLDAEIMQISTTKSWHMVVVLEVPQGIKLSTYLQQNGPMSEHFLMDKLIPQTIRVLRNLQDLGLCHGSINTEKVYVTTKQEIIIDECVSEPPGFSQPVMFEPFERMLMQPIGKGETDCSVDYYALGVVCLMCHVAKMPATLLDDDVLLRTRIGKGTFNAVAADVLRPGILHDFFRGILADLKSERWWDRQIQEWLKGRKLSISSLAYFEHASRNIVFNDNSHNSSRSLAYDLSHNWDAAGKFVRDPKLLIWLERSTNDEFMAERVNLAIQLVGTKGPMALAEDELLTHILLALNPQGPVVFRDIQIHFEGIGMALAYAFQKNRRDQLYQISRIITSSLIYTSEPVRMGHEQHAILLDEKADSGVWSLDKLKLHMERTEPGYGLERCLYELNSMLPCQSPTVIDDCVLQLPELLAALDQAAERKNVKLVDRHIAAFILDRLGKLSDNNLRAFQQFPKFGANPTIRALSILSMAERGIRAKPLPNLARAMARHLDSYIQLFHSRSIRTEMQRKLDVVVQEGNLSRIFESMSDFNALKKDHVGFDEARGKFRLLQCQIDQSSDAKRLYEIGYRQGLRMAVLLSFFVCGLVVIWMTLDYLRSTM
jgi:hypothetical protein